MTVTRGVCGGGGGERKYNTWSTSDCESDEQTPSRKQLIRRRLDFLPCLCGVAFELLEASMPTVLLGGHRPLSIVHAFDGRVTKLVGVEAYLLIIW